MKRSVDLTFPKTSSTLLLVLGTLATIGFAALLGVFAADQRMLILGGLVVGIPLLLGVFRSFSIFAALIPAVALLVPFSLPTGSGSRVSAVMLLVLLLTSISVLFMLVERRWPLRRDPLNKPLLTFAAVCCLAFVWSIVFRDPLLVRSDSFILAQIGALAAMVCSPLAALLIANFVPSEKHLWYIALLFVGVGIASTLAHFAHVRLPFNTRGLFPLWFAAVSWAMLIGLSGIRPMWRILLIAVFVLHAYAVGFLAIKWLSGWVPALVAIVVVTWLRNKIAFACVVAAIVVVTVAYGDWLYVRIIQEAEAEGSFERLTLWQLNWELIQDHPLFGTGPAGYALYYVTYHPSEARSTHNNYLDIVAQTGIIGVVCWVWIVIATIRESFAVLKSVPDGRTRVLAQAAVGGLVGSAVAMQLGDWILPFAYNQGIEGYRYTVFSWIFLGILMNLRQRYAPLPERNPQGMRYAPQRSAGRFNHPNQLEHP